LFGRIEINGKSKSKASLSPGDKLTVGGQEFIFREGLDEGEE
jgi:hypothetical protein